MGATKLLPRALLDEKSSNFYSGILNGEEYKNQTRRLLHDFAFLNEGIKNNST
jgi:hypothetical protein